MLICVINILLTQPGVCTYTIRWEAWNRIAAEILRMQYIRTFFIIYHYYNILDGFFEIPEESFSLFSFYEPFRILSERSLLA